MGIFIERMDRVDRAKLWKKIEKTGESDRLDRRNPKPKSKINTKVDGVDRAKTKSLSSNFQ